MFRERILIEIVTSQRRKKWRVSGRGACILVFLFVCDVLCIILYENVTIKYCIYYLLCIRKIKWRNIVLY